MQIKPVRSVALFAVLTILALAMSVGFLLWSLHEREIRHAEIETVNLTRMMMEQTQHNFEGADLALRGIQERLNTSFGRSLQLDSPTVHLLLAARLAGLRQVSSMFVVNAQGHVASTSLNISIPIQSVADRAYFKAFSDGQPDSLFVGRPVRNRIDSTWTLYLARPLLTPEGQFRGVVVAAVHISDLEQLYGGIQLDYTRPMAIYLTDGTLIASLPHRESMVGESAPELHGEDLPTHANQLRIIRHLSGDGGRLTYAIGKLAAYPVLLSVADDESLSLASWRETAIPIGMGAFLLMVFTVLIAVYLSGKLQHREILSRALSAADERYQHTVNAVIDAIVAVDSDMCMVLFNPSAEAMFGYKAADVLGKHLDVLLPQRFRGPHRGHMMRFSRAVEGSRAMAPQMDIYGLRADGSEFPVESTISHSIIGGQMQLTAVLRDVTERRKVEYELRMVNGQLRALSMSLQSVREEERKRISRELHDDLGQQMTGLKLSLSWLGNRIRDSKEIAVEQVDEMRRQLDGAISSVRRIAAEMRPRLLDDLDFREALTWQTREFFKHSNLQFSLDIPGADLVHDEEVSTALFRIAQEALTNVVRHANATQVHMSLLEEKGCLCLCITDNGQGFAADAGASGIGVVSMRERCVGIGADFQIISSESKGTTVQVIVPLEQMQA